MSQDRKRDVVVIGGGPAGSTSACYLAMRGYDVLVFERERFPRMHVGESLLPFCYEIFGEIGVREELERRFVRKPGVRFLDIDESTATTWCFRHTIPDASHLSFEVLREEFDAVLLDRAAELGAEVRQATRVREVEIVDADTVRVEAVDAGGRPVPVTARFLVDASGRDTFLAHRLGSKTAHRELQRTALSNNEWRGARYESGLEEGMLQIVYLGGEKQGWIWVIPLNEDRLSIGVALNTAYLRERRAGYRAGGVADWQEALYADELRQSSFLRRILAAAARGGEVISNGDYSYFCAPKHGDAYALVGDASAFIDPIFSSGVYLAMNSARLVADAIDVRLGQGREPGAAALLRTYGKVTGAYELVDKLIRLFYTPGVLNFAQLGSAEPAFSDYEHYRNVLALQHHLIAGDFFEVANRYSAFIDSLRDPNLFRRYQRYALERPERRAARSCGYSAGEIFPGVGRRA